MTAPRSALIVLAAALSAACVAGAEPASLPQTAAAIVMVPGDTIAVVPTPCRLPPAAGMVWLWHPIDPPFRVGAGIPLGTGRSCVVRPDSLPEEPHPEDRPER